MTLALRMGQTARHVSRFAAGMFGAMAFAALLPAAPAKAFEPATAPASTSADTSANPPLWVIRDADSTVYLFGTIHILKPETQWLTDKVTTAFDSADTLWVEATDADNPAVIAPVIQQLGMDPARPLSSLLNTDEAAALNTLLEAQGMNLAAVDPMRPWMAAFVVAMSAPLQAGYAPDAGADKVLMARARQQGMKLQGFESAEHQMRLIATMSDEAQLAYLNHYVRINAEMVADLDQTVAAWQSGDTATVGRLNSANTRLVHSEVHQAILVNRNSDWAEQIETLMQGSGTAFVAVGAGHLMDQDNLLDMLAKRGFTPERL